MKREKFIALKINFTLPGPQIGVEGQRSFITPQLAKEYIEETSYKNGKELWLIVKEPELNDDKLEIIYVKNREISD